MKKLYLLATFAFTFSSYGQCFDNIAVGEKHTIAIKSDGSVSTWGQGSWGALGFGTTSNVLTPTQLGTLLDWNSIFVGSYNTFIIKTNGTLWATGSNESGELGTGTLNNTNLLTQIGSSNNWSNISSNRAHTLGVRANGTLWAWGSNYNSKLGDGTNQNRLTPTQIGSATNWEKVSTGKHQSLGLKSDGTIWGWGLNISGALGLGISGTYNTPTQIGTDNDWVDITSGPGSIHTLALKNNGKLYVFGGTWSGGSGCLGLGPNINVANFPVQIGNDTYWQSISVGFNTSFAIKTDGTLWGWGQNDKGQLGDGTNVDKNIPTQIGTDTDWAVVAAGQFHTAALKTNGNLYTWGDNTYGQLGSGNYTSSNVPNAINPCVLSNEQFSDENSYIYPNPAKNAFNISYKSGLLSADVEIYDLMGRLVLKSSINTIETKATIDIHNLMPGTYNIILKSAGKIALNRKLVKI